MWCTTYKEETLKTILFKERKYKDTKMTVSFLHFNETGTTLIPVDYDVSFIGTLLMPTTTTMKTIQTDML